MAHEIRHWSFEKSSCRNESVSLAGSEAVFLAYACLSQYPALDEFNVCASKTSKRATALTAFLAEPAAVLRE